MAAEPVTPHEIRRFAADVDFIEREKHEQIQMEVANRNIQPTQTQVDYLMDIVEDEGEKRKVTVIETMSKKILAAHRIIKFRGKVMILTAKPYAHYRPINAEQFADISYPVVGGIPRSKMNDAWSFVRAVCDDLTPSAHLIGFGQAPESVTIEADTDLVALHKNKPVVWDMKALKLDRTMGLSDCVWRSPYAKVDEADGKEAGVCDEKGRLKFIMQLAGGDEDLYSDIMQSIAPIIMAKKPDGVVWWIGSGANGKSTLMDALYRIFPRHFSSINVKRLVDGRDAPTLNGVLANIVKEGSEGRIDDTEIYKCLGTHENFRVHRFHSQDDIEINGNLHTVFSANSIPIFADKGYSIRRRTFIIPFNQEFETDPDFEHKTFTKEFFGCLISEMFKYAEIIKKQNYRYKWSAKTAGAKHDYDREASNAEEYAAQIVRDGIVAFNSFTPVRVDYENWCADEGYPPLGITNLRKAIAAAGFERVSSRVEGESVSKLYRLYTVDGSVNLTTFGMGRPGFFTIDGFAKPEKISVPDFPETEKKSILNNKW